MNDEIDDLTIGAVMRRISILENDLRMLEARHKALVAVFYQKKAVK